MAAAAPLFGGEPTKIVLKRIDHRLLWETTRKQGQPAPHPIRPEREPRPHQGTTSTCDAGKVDGLKRQMGDMRHQIGEIQSQLGELLGLFRAQASATQEPPPKLASTFAAVTAPPDPSGQARSDFQSAISKLQPYAGQYDEATRATYPTPYAFTQKVEFIAERSKGQVDDETLIGAVASILEGASLTWYTGQYPSGTRHPALHSWASFRDLFLAEHMDPDQSSISADNLIGDKRCVQMHPGRHSLTEYIRVFQQEMSLLATSASIGQPNAPGPPNDAWKKEFFWAGLHPALRGALASERSRLRDVTALKTRALQIAAGFDEDTKDEPAGCWTTVPKPRPPSGKASPSSSSNVSQRTSLCTHPSHQGPGLVHHTWDQCSHNPSSPNYQSPHFRRPDSHGHRLQGRSGPSPQAPQGVTGTVNSVRGILGASPSLRDPVPRFTEESSGEPGVSGGPGIAVAALPNVT